MAKTTTRSTTKSRSTTSTRSSSAGKSSSRSAAGTATKKNGSRTTTVRKAASPKNGTPRSEKTRNGTARNGTAKNGAIARNSPRAGKKKKVLRELAENVEETSQEEDLQPETAVDEQDALRAREIDVHFNQLTDITDQVALVNSNYESDLDAALTHMEKFIRDAMGWDLQEMAPRALRTYLSHMSFHREIVAEIISEARRQLIEGRRGYLKRLVSYHKEFITWFGRVEKKYAA